MIFLLLIVFGLHFLITVFSLFQLQPAAAARTGATARRLRASQVPGASQEPPAGGTDVSLL